MEEKEKEEKQPAEDKRLNDTQTQSQQPTEERTQGVQFPAGPPKTYKFKGKK